MSWSSNLPKRAIVWAVFAAIAFLWFANLGSRALLHPDEGRYAEIAREMAASGDWVTPRLNGLKYLEKPPLQYWITAASYRMFGVHEWTARLWPALAGLLAVAAIGISGCALGGPALGVFAAIALAGTLWHAGMAQIVSLDSGLAFFLALAFAGLVIAQRAGTGAATRRRWMWVTWGAMAGAVLSKGPVGIVLPAGVLVVYTIINRDWELWRRLHLKSGIAIFLLITAPRFIAVTRANDEFFTFFFVHEHFQRFLTEEHQRAGPWYYFIPLAAAGSLPLLAILAFGVRRIWHDGGASTGIFSWRRLALVWAAFVFVFFSVSGSKLPSYILPMFAPLALVAADLLLTQPTTSLSRQALPGAVVISVVAVGLLLGYDRIVARLADGPQPVEVLQAYGPWLKAAVGVAAVGAAAAVLAFRRATLTLARKRTLGRFWGSAALASPRSSPSSSPLQDSRPSARHARHRLSSERRRWRRPFRPLSPFIRSRCTTRPFPSTSAARQRWSATATSSPSGSTAEPERQIPTIAQWINTWLADRDGYAVLLPADYERLAADGLPMRVLARDTRRVIVSRK
jgi:4-amino-4-deoxy-L-arabinose transferase-like glycosyltransferase